MKQVTLQLTPEEVECIESALQDNIAYARNMLNDWGINTPADVIDAGKQLVLAGTILTKLKGESHGNNKKKK